MARYKQLDFGVYDTENNKAIPEDPKNKDYKEYLQWLIDGYVVDPIDPEPDWTGDQLLDESDESMIRAIDWMITFFIAKGTIKIEDLPTELRDLYEARQNYFTAVGGVYTEESKLKKIWKIITS